MGFGAVPACVEYPDALVSIDELRALLPASKLPDPSVNPGNAINCSAFKTWKQANTWYARYAAWGDVAGLDGKTGRVGVVCEGAPGHP